MIRFSYASLLHEMKKNTRLGRGSQILSINQIRRGAELQSMHIIASIQNELFHLCLHPLCSKTIVQTIIC